MFLYWPPYPEANCQRRKFNSMLRRFSRAFDLINRHILFYKTIKTGLHGRILDSMRSLYAKPQFRLICNGSLSPLLATSTSVNQGGNASSCLFRRYLADIQYIPRNMHTVFALLCFVVVIHWLIFPYPSGLLHWHCGNLTIAPVPAKQPWWIWINTSCGFIMNDCITTTKQSTTKPCAYFLGYTVGDCLSTSAGVCLKKKYYCI